MPERPRRSKPEPAKSLPPHLQRLVDLLPLKQWVPRQQLEQAYGRQEVKRRLRKIRAEYGWDIRSERRSGGANDDWYMSCSEGPVRPQHIRKEVTKAERQAVYLRDSWTCQICNCDVGEGQFLTDPKCDHKVPAERGGPTSTVNLQTLCNQCNLKKRQACSLCRLPDCTDCPYAFPERHSSTLVLRLSQSVADKLKMLSKKAGVPPITIIEQLISGS